MFIVGGICVLRVGMFDVVWIIKKIKYLMLKLLRYCLLFLFDNVF